MLIVGLLILLFLIGLSDGYSIGAIIFLAIIIGVIYFCWKMATEIKFNNKNLLDVDPSKMSGDIANGIPKSEIRRRIANGWYDKDKK